MRHGSLFTGIGGFDLAAEWMGWENVFHCEWNEFGQKVLKYYWPNAISYGDITKTDFTVHRGRIDILTGGFPCQPFSLAGKRKGTADDRHLWPEMLRAIREIQPLWIVGENVPGIVNWDRGLVFEQVQSDLESEGYEVQPVILPACGVNAPHRRDRVWFVAHSNRNGRDCKESRRNEGKSEGCWIRQQYEMELPKKSNNSWRFPPDTESKRQSSQQTRSKEFRSSQGQGLYGGSSNGEGGRWSNFPTQSPLCSRDDELSSRLVGITFSKHRNESIKAYGNAVVPELVYQIFKAIEQYNNR